MAVIGLAAFGHRQIIWSFRDLLIRVTINWPLILLETTIIMYSKSTRRPARSGNTMLPRRPNLDSWLAKTLWAGRVCRQLLYSSNTYLVFVPMFRMER